MPQSALQNVEVDHCLTLRDIAPLLEKLASTPAAKEGAYPVSERMKIEVEIAMEDTAVDKGIQDLFEPSNYTCPECHGALLQLKEGGILRFRCHTGHAYSTGALLEEGQEMAEGMLWSAIRSLEKRVLLLRQLAEHLESHNHNEDAAAILPEIEKTRRKGNIVRQAVTSE
jgi:two-component system, chemotaxis family, protein-glutamate methylesterase/glutaminase